MAEVFKFKSGIKTIEIQNEDGSPAFTLTVNVGEKESVKVWMKELRSVADSVPKSTDDFDTDQLFEIEQRAVKSILGDEQFSKVWEHCGHNVLAMLGFVKYLTGFLNGVIQDFYKDYV